MGHEVSNRRWDPDCRGVLVFGVCWGVSGHLVFVCRSGGSGLPVALSRAVTALTRRIAPPRWRAAALMGNDKSAGDRRRDEAPRGL